MEQAKKAAQGQWRTLVALFFAIVLVILAGGYAYYHTRISEARQEAVKRLTAVGGLKLNLLTEWRRERLSDALRSASAPFFRQELEDWLETPEAVPLPAGFQEQLILDTTAYGFADALLISLDGELLASASGAASRIGPGAHAVMAAALTSRESVMTDPYLRDDGEGPFIDTVAVIPGSDDQALGYILLRNDARDYLLELIEPWPTPTDTAEVMLVRAENDDALIMSGVRHRDDGPMAVRLPLSDEAHPVVQAVLGHQGVVEGLDYRQKRVMADIRPVPGTAWFLVSKIDEAELFAEAHYRARTAALIALLAILLAAGAISIVYRRQQSGMYRKLYAAERRERQALEEVRTTLYSIGDAVITTDTTGRIRRMNPAAVKLTQWPEAEAEGKPLHEVLRIVDEESRMPAMSPVEAVLNQAGAAAMSDRSLLIARDGSEHPAAATASPILDEHGAASGIVLVFRDQSEEREAERALRESEERFRGLYESAAVGILIHDAETGAILDANRKAITDYGLDTLEELQAHDVWLEPPYSREDALRVIRKAIDEGPQRTEWKSRDVHGQDFWEEVTTCAVPMDETVRVISIAHDITERKLAQEALARSQAEMARFFDVSLDLLCITKVDSTFLKLNGAWHDVLGFEAGQLVGKRFLDFVHPDDLDATVEAMRQLAERKPVDGFVNRYRTVNGDYRFIEWRAACPDGDIIYAAARDITHRRETERALQHEKERLESAEAVGRMGSWEYNTTTGEVWMSPQMYDLLGIDPAEGAPSPELYFNALHPGDRPEHEKAFAELLAGGAPKAPLFRSHPDRGEVRFFESRVHTRGDAGENGVKFVGIVRDITERKRAEDDLNKLLLLLAEAEAIASLGAWELDMATGVATWSDEVYALHEIEKGRGQNLESALDFYHPDDRPVIERAVQDAIETHEPYDLVLRFHTAKGNFRWVRTSGKPIVENERVVRLVGMFQDITQHRLAEEALQRELEFSQRLIANMADGFSLLDPNGVCLDVNDALCSMTGLARDEIIGKGPPHPYWPPEEMESIREAFQECMALRPRPAYELAFMRKSGERFPVIVSPSYLLDAEGAVTNYFATVKDMTDSKRAHEERERLLSAIEQSSESIIITDVDGLIEYVNPAFERITGYSRAEAVGQNPSILKSGEQDEEFYRALWHTITAGDTWYGRLRNKRKDGSLYTEAATISPVRDHTGAIVNFVAVKRDIGREEELETQLRQAQKMDAVGRLAGGIAHDFNNMLGVILGHTELALEQTESESPLHEDLLQVQRAGKRSADLTRQLLSFARKQTIVPLDIDLNEAVNNTLSMLKRLIGENIKISWEPASEPVRVKLDPSQLDQILINLTVNARDAIGGTDGRITIATGHEAINGDGAGPIPDAAPGSYATLAVHDTGCGMDASTVEHLFEPFFSTKEMGRGTGLGLATVYGIVKQHDGHISVESTPEVGTVFRIYFPAYDGAVSLPRGQHEPAATPRIHGTETILLVEDEAPLLAVSKRFLERLGYAVLAAPGPNEALAAAADADLHIDLLLTDVVMPGMNGRDVWERLRGERPGMKCLFVSGYTADIIADHGVVDESVHFLQKPFTMQALAAKVREVLGKGVERNPAGS